MKKLIFIFMLSLISVIANSQTFASAFETWDNINGYGGTYNTNLGNDIQANQTILLQSYLNMFKATKDIHYLEKFAVQVTRIMERRDDYIGAYDATYGYNPNVGVFAYYVGLDPNYNYYANMNNSFGTPYSNTLFGYPYDNSGKCTEVLPDITNLEADANYYLNRVPNLNEGRSMTWSMDQNGADISCNQLYQPAMFEMICEQMAEFCYYLYEDPDFGGIANDDVPQEVSNIMHEPYAPTYSDWTSGTNSNSITTYADFADWLYYHICQTDHYIYHTCWDFDGTQTVYDPVLQSCIGEKGYWTYPNFWNGHGEFAQTNQQCAIGKTLLYLWYYTANVLHQSNNGPYPDFLGRLQEIGQLAIHQLQPNFSDYSYNINNFPLSTAWAYVGDENNYSFNSPCTSYNGDDSPEDFVHASLLMQFADLCYRFKLPYLGGGPSDIIFTKPYMQYLANSFARDMTISPLYYLPVQSASEPALSGSPLCRWSQYVCGENDIVGCNEYTGATTPVTGAYVFLTAYNPYIYAEVLNDYAYVALYNPSAQQAPIAYAGNNQPYTALALFEHANIYDQNNSNGYSTYQNIFNPVAVYPDVNSTASATSQITSLWSSATSGNYDGSATNLEFVSSVLNTNSFVMSEVQTTYTNSINYNVVTFTANLTGNILNLTSGNYAGSGTDYVAVTDGTYLDIDQKSGNSFNSVFNSGPCNLTSYNLAGGWATMATIKRPDNTTGDAVFAADEYGNGIIYEYTGGTPKIWTSSGSFYEMFFNNPGGISSGYFDGSNNPQELATVDLQGDIHIFSISVVNNNNNNTGGSFSLTPIYFLGNLFSQSQQINGIASGNFDGLGQDAIITHSPVDGCFRIYKVRSGSLDTVGFQAFPDGTGSLNEMPDWSGPNYFRSSQWWGMGIITTIKNFPGSPGDALATFRNCDGRIMVFDMQGVCEGQNVSNDYFWDGCNTCSSPSPITPCTTLVSVSNNPYSNFANDYTLDYNANNTLTASNDMVSSGTSVQFTAGNAVILQNGFTATSGSYFDAKIDNSLSCGANQVFHKPVHHAPPSGGTNLPPFATTPGKKDSLGVQSKPSPTTGQFSVSLIKIDSNYMGQEANVTVWNMLGQNVFQGNMLVENDNQIPIDLTGRANGVYMIVVKTKDKVFHKKILLEK